MASRSFQRHPVTRIACSSRDMHGNRRLDPSVEMARILDVPPVLNDAVWRDGTRLTGAWDHSGLQDIYQRGVGGHVIVACHEGEHEISWRVENKLHASRTSRKAFTIIPRSVDGRWHIAGPVKVSHVYLTQERVRACADEMSRRGNCDLLIRIAYPDPTVAALLETISNEVSRGCCSTRLFIEQAINLLCILLIERHSTTAASNPGASSQYSLPSWRMKRIADYVREHLGEDIGLTELAELAGLSKYHFCSAFKKATGFTPYKWVIRARMDRAQHMLVHTNLSVTEIGLAVGYDTPSAFASAFRKNVGVTPTRFKRGT